ncbi:hypothetical protein [Aeromonas veronii]|nr:hypothetical protein [Aeromonas veronii]
MAKAGFVVMLVFVALFLATNLSVGAPAIQSKSGNSAGIYATHQ